MSSPPSDYDGAWKEALERYFADFMAFFFPRAYAEIDWRPGYEFLDQELRQIAPDAELGDRRVDKLARVWRYDGEAQWVLVHVEFQGQRDAAFAERMYVYNYRIFDRYHRWVSSMAILGDETAAWRPANFGYELWGCRVDFDFPMVKLADFRLNWPELEADRSPFATIVMAHLKSQETSRDEGARLDWKLALTRRLYERGYRRDDIIQLYRFIDWLMQLPPELEARYWDTIDAYEEASTVTYVTYAERIGIEKGLRQGREEGLEQGREEGLEQGREEGIRLGLLAAIELGLELRFGAQGLQLYPELTRITDNARLQIICNQLKTVATIADLQKIYADW